MTNPTVYLGWCRLLETNAEGLAAVHGLCGALEVRTHWAPDLHTLYVESPVQGRTVWLEAGGGSPRSGLRGVLATAAGALEAAGARVITPGGDPVGRAGQLREAGPDVMVHLAGGSEDVLEAVFSITVPGRSRLLARTLLAAAAAATGLPAGEARFRWPRAPLAAALAGVDCPAAALVVPEAGGASVGALAHATWEAVMRFLAPPELADLLDRLAVRRTPAAAPGLELPPVAGGEDTAAASPPPADLRRAARPAPGTAAPAAGGNPFRPPGARHVYMFRVLSGGRAAFSLHSGPPAPATAAPGPTAAPAPTSASGSGRAPASEPMPAADPAPMPPSPLVAARPAPPAVSFRPSPGAAPPPGGRFPARPGRAVPLQGPVRRRRGHWQSSGLPE